MKYLHCIKEYYKRQFLELTKGARYNAPMANVILALEIAELLPSKIIALDVFGKHGLWNTKDFAHRCDYLEMWELDPTFARFARWAVPNANVVCGNSIEAVRNNGLTRQDFNFVVIDNPAKSPYGDKYCEHFDLFPQILDYLAPDSVLIFHVIPRIRRFSEGATPQQLTQWEEARKKFYETQDSAIPLERVERRYEKFFSDAGIQVRRSFVIPRHEEITFLVYALHKA